MGVIYYNGRSSKDYNIEVELIPDYEYPEKEYDIYHVPGRNGDIYIDKGSYKNIKKQYQISAYSPEKSFFTLAGGVTSWLHSASGYARLEDSYEPDYFRLAAYSDDGSLLNLNNEALRTVISFDCKPQKFLKIGEKAINIPTRTAEETNNSYYRSIYNPTEFKSNPLIKISFKNNTNGFSIRGIDNGTSLFTVVFYKEIGSSGTIYIDSELQDVYKYNGSQMENINNHVSIDFFPFLINGETSIEINDTGAEAITITKIEVIPRWWTL